MRRNKTFKDLDHRLLRLHMIGFARHRREEFRDRVERFGALTERERAWVVRCRVQWCRRRVLAAAFQKYDAWKRTEEWSGEAAS
jgi:hypothetical protein